MARLPDVVRYKKAEIQNRGSGKTLHSCTVGKGQHLSETSDKTRVKHVIAKVLAE